MRGSGGQGRSLIPKTTKPLDVWETFSVTSFILASAAPIPTLRSSGGSSRKGSNRCFGHQTSRQRFDLKPGYCCSTSGPELSKRFWQVNRSHARCRRSYFHVTFKGGFVLQRCGSVFAQVCHHNTVPSHSKCFWIGMCSLSKKMESRGGSGIWKGNICGPPVWVFTFEDKWSHWVAVSCEWAPSTHTGFLMHIKTTSANPGHIPKAFNVRANRQPLQKNASGVELQFQTNPAETPGSSRLKFYLELKLSLKDLLFWPFWRMYTENLHRRHVTSGPLSPPPTCSSSMKEQKNPFYFRS